jgi:branched-chain amino acid transport system permease protein
MRTSGIFFLMVTLALGMVVFGLAYRLSTITGGENGLTGIHRPFAQTWQFYYFSAAVLLVVLVALWVLQRSPFGLVLNGIRDSESRMTSLGYWVPAYKFSAMMVSGLVSGIAGVMSVWHSEFVSPAAAGFMRSALAVLIVILGGVGTLSGPLIGAAIVVWAEFVLSTHFERWPTALGVVFIVVVLFAPKGISGGLVGLARRRTTRSPRAKPAFAQQFPESQDRIGAVDKER